MELFNLFGKIEVDNDEANKAIDETSEKGEKAEGKLGKFFSSIGHGAAVAGKAIAAGMAVGGAAIGALVTKSLQAYADYEQLAGGVDTLFKNSSQKVQEYAQNAYKTAGMSANEYMETVTGFSASLLQSLGGDTEAAAEKADMAITDMADNANKMGSTMESIQNAYQGFAKQNYTMLDNLKLGYGGTKEEMQRLLEDAQAISGIKYDISSYADVVDAIHVIQTEMEITGTTAKEASSTISGSIASMKGAWSNLVTAMLSDNMSLEDNITAFVDSVGTVAANILPKISVALDGVVQMIDQLVPIIAEKLPEVLGSLLPALIDGATALIDGLVSAFPQIVNALQGCLPALVDGVMQIFNSLTSALPQILQVFADIIGEIGRTLSTTLPQLIPSVVASILDIVDVIVNNIPTFIGAITDVIYGIVDALPALLQTLTDRLPEIVNDLIYGVLPELLAIFTDCLPELINGITYALVKFVPSLIDAVVGIITAIAQALPGLIQSICDTIPILIEKIVTALVSFTPQLVSAFVQLIESVVAALPGILEAIVTVIPTLIQSIVTAIVELVPALVEGLIQVVNALAAAIPEIIPPIIEALPTILDAIISGLLEVLPVLIEGLLQVIVAIAQAIPEIIPPLVAAIPEVISLIITALLDNLPAIITGLIQVVAAIVVALPQIFGALITAVPAVLSGIWDGIKSVFGNIGSWFGTLFSGAWEAIKSAWSAVVDWFSGIWDGIKNAFSAVVSWFGDIFKKAWNAIKSAWSAVVNWFVNIWNSIKNAFSSVGSWFGNIFSSAWSGIKSAWSGVGNFFSGVWDGIKGIFGSVGSWFGNIFSGAWTAIKNVFSGWGQFFGDLWTKCKDKFTGIGTKIGNSVSNAVKQGINGIISVIENTINGGIKLINGAINLINKIPGPDIPKIKLLSLPRLAKGGLVEEPTVAEIGEAGREAVIPLEKNTEGLDLIAEKISERMNGNNGNKVATFGTKVVNGAVKWSDFSSGLFDDLKNFFGIRGNRSHVMKNEIGESLANGVIDGIAAKTDAAKKSMKTLGNKVVTQAKTNKTEVLKVAQEELDSHKKYNDLTAASEAEYWDIIRQQFKEGTAERLEADKLYADAKAQIDDELIQSATKRLDEYSTYNELTLAEEVAFWDNIRQQCQEGTDQRLEADRNYLEAKKSLNEELLAAEETLQSSLDEIQQQIDDRAASIQGSFDLFSDFEYDEFVSAKDMMDTIDSNVAVLERYKTAMDELRTKIGDTDLFAELEEMGVQGLSKILTINGMTDIQLQMYTSKYDDMVALSKITAKTELEEETQAATLEAINTFNDTISALGVATDVGQPSSNILADIVNQVNDVALQAFSDTGLLGVENATIMNNPTIFGYSADGKNTGGKSAGKGDYGETTLTNMIQNAVAAQSSELNGYLQQIVDLLTSFFPAQIEAFSNMKVQLDTGAIVGELVVPFDEALGVLSGRKERGR